MDDCADQPAGVNTGIPTDLAEAKQYRIGLATGTRWVSREFCGDLAGKIEKVPSIPMVFQTISV